MLDPDTLAFTRATKVMGTGQMVGEHRPVGRVTVSRNVLDVHPSSVNAGLVREVIFGSEDRDLEREALAIVKGIQIQRSVDDDAATCTITLANDGSNLNSEPQGSDWVGREGYWTPGRQKNERSPVQSIYKDTDQGDESAHLFPPGFYPTSWNYPAPDAYNMGHPDPQLRYSQEYLTDLFIPNRVVRTYQGYGSQNVDDTGEQLMPADDGYVPPWEDEYLFRTGIWLINRATVNQDGYLTLECSDLAKLLIKQIIYPPMIPMDRFPLVYCPITEAIPPKGDKGGRGKNVAKGYHSSSNDPWYGRGASLYGHSPYHAFDGRPDTYWLSVGNAGPTRPFAYEWIQTPCGGNEVNEISVSMRGGNYVCFVSVMENGSWQGGSVVPYDPNHTASFPNGANIPYVKRTTISGGNVSIRLPRAYKAQYVRVCFWNLAYSGLGTYPYRAMLREFRCYWQRPNTYEAGVPSNRGKPGAIESWTDAVKEMLAWGGFTWVADPNVYPDVPPDPLLGKEEGTGIPLRVWGDLEITPGPEDCSSPDQFLNKSFMEGINQIKEWLGCIFFVDESGGAVFRLPNIFKGGNFIHDPEETDESPYVEKEWPIEFHENANLMDYSLVFDDEQLRSEILVVGDTPDNTAETMASSPILGGVVLQDNIPGMGGSNATTEVDITSVLAGQYRLMIPPSENTKGFKKEEEAQRMAELTALFILFTYRRGQITAPAHPGLQLDDQVRVFNRVANEYNVQYVSSISTEMDLDEGIYQMEVDAHWLGGDPDTDWFFDRYQITPAMENYPAILRRIGEAKGGDT